MKSLFSESKCQVVSKYFQNTNAMDDSLLDFQEKKQLKLPKKAPRSNSNRKVKLKKKLGQKDIRDVIKGKCNDLTAHTKIFDKNCKSDCVDIDSEELQLAIAVTRSLQNNLPDENKDSEDFISQASKIRTTLLEYGFRAPKVKAAPAKRVLRKHKKNYKLLSITDEEKKQLITDRYSQVLFQNLSSSDASTRTVQKDLSNIPFYFVGTNILYNDIRDDHIFFIEGLIEKSTNTAGCLLKDWSKIPGRPISPCPEYLDVNFKNVKCPQEKLDTILRGSLSSAKAILKSCPLLENEGSDSIVSKSKTIDTNISQDNIENKCLSSTEVHNMNQNQNNSKTMQSQQYRCVSPDIFDDDEVISIIDSPGKIKGTLVRHSKINTEDMNLTECVTSNFADDKPLTSDLMELTDCCGAKSQSVNAEGEHKNNLTTRCLNVEIISQVISIEDHNEKESIENVDLTQSSDEDTLPFVQISGSINKKPDVINVDDGNTPNGDENSKVTSSRKTTNETDFTEKEELMQHKKKFEKENHSSDVSIEEYVYVHSDESINEKSDILSENCVPIIEEASDNCKIDLTQSSKEETLMHECYDDENIKKQHDVSAVYDQSNFSNVNNSCLEDVINLSNQVSGDIKSQNIEILNECSNKSGETNLKSNSKDISSQNSVVFEISDTELNYSMQKSKQDNFNFGIESILHDLSNDQNYKESSENYVCFKDDDNSYLPEVQVKPKTSPAKSKKEEVEIKLSNSKDNTPLRRNLTDVHVETPNNSEYLIKSDQVTPLQDYASMTTPDRNKELDKYGLKPLKRKRAVQLLTHIYNQTHPIVEECLDLPSTPKKRKSNDSVSPNTSRSPKKFHENGTNQCINNLGIKEIDLIDLYEVTSEIPLIGDLKCAPDDWVFQRKEKAKVGSCRVPLHIAFHNYVSCRQRLRETILRYEPINIDLIHKQLAASGHKYDPKDLLRFLDKRCITVKTTDNDSRNGKK